MKLRTKKSGFTLVELAIVLVIIGLIVGGVLAGADLIKAAAMQKAVKQVSDTETGAATFRNKYNELPGDLRNASSIISGGGWTSGGSTAAGLGNGNGLIEAPAVAAGNTLTATVGMAGETLNFYPMLSSAGYVKESLDGQPLDDIAVANADIKAALLPSALGGNAYMIASTGTGTGADGRNYIVLFGAPSGDAGAGVATLSGGITPLQASNFDSKLDDGAATTGGVKSLSDTAPIPQTADTGGAAECNTSDTYNASLETKLCNISIRASF